MKNKLSKNESRFFYGVLALSVVAFADGIYSAKEYGPTTWEASNLEYQISDLEKKLISDPTPENLEALTIVKNKYLIESSKPEVQNANDQLELQHFKMMVAPLAAFLALLELYVLKPRERYSS